MLLGVPELVGFGAFFLWTVVLFFAGSLSSTTVFLGGGAVLAAACSVFTWVLS